MKATAQLQELGQSLWLDNVKDLHLRELCAADREPARGEHSR